MNLQENFYDTYQQLTENLTIAIECLPMCFYYDYEKIKYYEIVSVFCCQNTYYINYLNMKILSFQLILR